MWRCRCYAHLAHLIVYQWYRCLFVYPPRSKQNIFRRKLGKIWSRSVVKMTFSFNFQVESTDPVTTTRTTIQNEIDEQKNLISIQMDLWTFWSDPRLALSNGEIIGWANEYFPVRTAIESLLTQFEKLGILLSLTKRQKPKCGTLRLSLKMYWTLKKQSHMEEKPLFHSSWALTNLMLWNMVRSLK